MSCWELRVKQQKGLLLTPKTRLHSRYCPQLKSTHRVGACHRLKEAELLAEQDVRSLRRNGGEILYGPLGRVKFLGTKDKR